MGDESRSFCHTFDGIFDSATLSSPVTPKERGKTINRAGKATIAAAIALSPASGLVSETPHSPATDGGHVAIVATENMTDLPAKDAAHPNIWPFHNPALS
jgi:hypothetical protein